MNLSLILYIRPHLCAVSVQGPHQRFLLTELLKDYNPMERPVANDSQALTVQFSFILMQVMDVVRTPDMSHKWNDTFASSLYIYRYFYFCAQFCGNTFQHWQKNKTQISKVKLDESTRMGNKDAHSFHYITNKSVFCARMKRTRSSPQTPGCRWWVLW